VAHPFQGQLSITHKMGGGRERRLLRNLRSFSEMLKGGDVDLTRAAPAVPQVRVFSLDDNRG